MNIMAVDSDWLDRMRLKRLLKKAMPDATIHVFAKGQDALELARGHPIDAAFIDMGRSIHIPGYYLAQHILEVQRTNIIFTNYERTYLEEALELRVSGYLRKPLRYEEVLSELQNLRYLPSQDQRCGEPFTDPPFGGAPDCTQKKGGK